MPTSIWHSEPDLRALDRLDEAGLAGAFMRRWDSYRDDYRETVHLTGDSVVRVGKQWSRFCERWRLRFPA
ncbi:MAG: DUF6499 domain-containing protein [Gluconacetobacter sp.]